MPDPRSWGPDLASSGRPPPASRRDGTADPESGGAACGWASWAYPLDFSFFYFFNLIYRGGQETVTVKITINRDLVSKAVAKTASVNAFCPPPQKYGFAANELKGETSIILHTNEIENIYDVS